MDYISCCYSNEFKNSLHRIDLTDPRVVNMLADMQKNGGEDKEDEGEGSLAEMAKTLPKEGPVSEEDQGR